MERSTEAEILTLERSMIDPPTRYHAAWLDRLIADDFREFGKYGAVYDKDTALQTLSDEPEQPVSQYGIAAPTFMELTPDVVLLTYTLTPLVQSEGEPLVASLRSSIWKRIDARWQIVFHQGTALVE